MKFTKEERQMILANIKAVEGYLNEKYISELSDYDSMYCTFDHNGTEHCFCIRGTGFIGIKAKTSPSWISINGEEYLMAGVRTLLHWNEIKTKLADDYERIIREREQVTTGFVL